MWQEEALLWTWVSKKMRRFIKRCNQPVSLSLFSFCICVRDFLEKKEEESSSASSSSSYFILRVPHGSLWLASADWNTTDRPPHVTGFTFQQQVSVLSAAAEKTRQRARWCSGYRPEPHTHTRERVCGSQASGRKKHNSRWPGRHQDGPLWSVSLSLSLSLQFFNISCLFIRIQTGHPTISIVVLFCYRAKSSLLQVFVNCFQIYF